MSKRRQSFVVEGLDYLGVDPMTTRSPLLAALDEQHEEAESAARYATRQAEINRLRGEIRDQSMKEW